MTSIDTNVLVRLIIRDNLDQVSAAQEFVARGTWVSILALAEAIWVLESTYKMGSDEVAQAIGMLLEQEQVTMQDSDAVAIALTQFRARPAIEFSDYLMLELARKAGHLPLGTFDRKLARVAGAQKV